MKTRTITWITTRFRLALCLVLFGSLGYPATSAAVTFGPVTDYPVGTSPVRVAVGDFNGDGKMDMAVANSGSNFVSILLGNGDGTFQPAINADAGGPQTSIFVGDFNGDGKLDLLVDSGSPTGANGQYGVTILLGNGDGTFKPPVQIQSFANPVFLAVGDFNLDGHLDFVVDGQDLCSATCPTFLDVYLGKGDGTFQAPTSIAFGTGIPTFLAVADFNGDAKLDVAVVVGNQLRVLLGVGDGTFLPPVVTTATNWVRLSSLFVADFNSDKKPDLATTLTSDFQVCGRRGCHLFSETTAVLLLGNGDGTFQLRTVVPFSSSVNISGFNVGDVNGDGKPDLFIQRGTSSSIYLGKGDGTFPVVLPAGTLGPISFSTVFADLNGDNLPDLISLSHTPNNVSISLNTSPASGADLSAILSSNATSVQGQNMFYFASATNFGPQDATGVVMTVNLPAGSTFVSSSTSAANCTAVTTTVTCAIGPLVSADVLGTTLTFVPTIPGAATISSSVAANEPDLNPANNLASATFTVIPSFTLTVVKAGAGGGIVNDNMNQISCGTNCSSIYPNTATVNLTATADATSAFAGWSGACTGTDPNTCSVPMTANMTVTATFVPGVPLTVSLASTGAGSGTGTVTSTPPGINCSNGSCTPTANFATGSTVNLTAVATNGSTFANWSGACTGTDPNTCAVLMSAAESVTATFNPPPTELLTLNFAVIGTAGGTVTSTPAGISCTATCTASFTTGSTVNLKAVPAAGSSFAGWSQGCGGADPNVCAVVMNSAQAVTANFGPPADFSLNLATAEGVPSGGQVPDTITLTPQNGALNSVVNFTCSVSPALAECSFTPPSLTLGAAPATTTLNIVAIKPPGVASLAPRRPEWGLFASLWLPIPGLILAGIGFGSKQSRKKKLFASLLLVCMLCAGVISQSGCGGGSSSGGGGGGNTPPGQYNVTITATSGSIVHSQTIMLNVQ